MPITVKNPGGPVIGLDIGSNFIKACQAQVRAGRPEVTALAVLPTPSDAVSGTEILDPVSLGRSLKQLFATSGIKAKRVVSSVAGQSSLVVRIIEVPKMTAKELQETMKWEVERHVPFAAEQTVMDFQALSAPEEVADGQNMEVLLAVAQEEMVNTHVAALQAAGLTPRAIDIEPLAASRALVSLADNGNPAGTVAVVDMGAITTDISIFREGRIAFTRAIQIAGNTLTKAISDVLGQPLPQAERLKMELAAAPENAAVAGLFEDAVPDLGGFDFAGGETLSFDAPAAAGEAGAEPGAGTPFDVAGGGIGSSPFGDAAPEAPAPDTAASDEPLGQPTAAEFGFDLARDDSPAAESPQVLGGPEAAAAPFEENVFAAVPSAAPFAGDEPGASPFDTSLAAAPEAAPLPVPAVPAMPVGADEYVRQQIADAITPVLSELVTELRRSLDFYRSRASGQGAQRVIICGGTAKLPGLDRFLAQNLDVPVTVGNAMEFVGVSAPADADYLQELAPLFPVCVGLAVRDMLVQAAPPRARGAK